MKILHINTLDISGGAARAMHRLHTALIRAGHDSRIIAGFTKNHTPEIYSLGDITAEFENAFERGIDKVSQTVDRYFSVAHWLYPRTFYIQETDIFKQADVVNFHNLHSYYFNIKALSLLTHLKPSVWTMHDMWPLTGHCSYSYDCRNWVAGCFSCPLLRIQNLKRCEPRPSVIDISKLVWRIKRDIYTKSSLNIITPSDWLCKQAKMGILGNSLSFAHIPNGVDINIFKPLDKQESRKILNLPENDFILLFPSESVTQYRKGYGHLLAALKEFGAPVSLMVFGRKAIPAELKPKIKVLETGYIDSEELLCRYYSAADLVLLPTLADNQPLVIIEAMACARPVVVFDVGGVGEMVEHMKTGYKAVYKDSKDFAKGIRTFLEDKELYSQASRACRENMVKNYTLEQQTRKYIEFYEQAISEFNKRK